jgi:2-polyprenyl-3-methyl-5-hydroxy-6-metoxy-1,4-benzoquinol methylase
MLIVYMRGVNQTLSRVVHEVESAERRGRARINQSTPGTGLDIENSLSLNKEPRGNPIITAALEGLSKDVKILDVGCGVGNMMLFYRNLGYANIHGVEVQQDFIAFARNQWNLNISERPAEDLSCFEDKFFDVVYSNHVLEHILRPDASLREMHRVLKDDGVVFLGLPNGRHLDDILLRFVQKLYYGHSDHIQAFSYEGFCRLLAAAGLTVSSHSFNYESLHFLLDRRLPLRKFFAGMYSVAKRLYWDVHSFDIIARKTLER